VIPCKIASKIFARERLRILGDQTEKYIEEGVGRGRGEGERGGGEGRAVQCTTCINK
jgi:hypothetical protein